MDNLVKREERERGYRRKSRTRTARRRAYPLAVQVVDHLGQLSCNLLRFFLTG